MRQGGLLNNLIKYFHLSEEMLTGRAASERRRAVQEA